MYALLKTKSFIVTVSVRSLFFYSSVYDLKTIWMWEAMYCTVVMPYKNKMSSSSVSLDSLMEEREATERYDGRKISSLYLQNHLKTFLFFIAYSSSTRLQWEKDVLQKEGSASAVEFLSPEVNKPWAYALTRTYASSGYYSTTAFILVFVSFVHAAVLCGMNELEKQHLKGTKKHKKSNSKVRTTNELPLVKKSTVTSSKTFLFFYFNTKTIN